MKKKQIIIPVICAFLVVVIGVLTVTLTTPLSFKLHSDRFVKQNNPYGPSGDVIPTPLSKVDWFYLARSCGKTMNTVYRLNPSVENLIACNSIYSAKKYIYGSYFGCDMPDDFTDKCAFYAKEMYETEYEKLREYNNYVPIGDDIETQMKLTLGFEYALALYIDGQVSESQALAEELSPLVKGNFIFAYILKDYFYYVNATSDDASVRSWVLAKEAETEQLVKASGMTDSFYEKHDSFFSNPDLATYINGDWDEYSEDAKGE